MSDIQEITAKIRTFRDEREWGQFHNHKDVALSLVLEASEVLEHFQWKSAAEVEAHGREAKDEIADELADVAIYLFELADNLRIDLPRAIARKMDKNAVKYPKDKAKGRHTKYNKLVLAAVFFLSMTPAMVWANPMERAIDLSEQGKFEEAVKEFNLIIKENPTDASAYTNRGLTYERWDKIDLAVQDYSTAIAMNPKNASALNNRAALYADTGEFERAIADLNQALTIVPEDGQIYLNRALIYNHIKEYAKAWEDMTKAESFGVKADVEFVNALKQALGR